MVDEAIFRSDQDLLFVLALGFGALVVVQAAIEALRGWALRVFGHLLSFQIVGNLVRHMMRLPADFFEKRHVGDIFSRIGAVQPIQDAITRGVIAAIIDGVMAFIAALILFFYSPMLAAIVLFATFLHLVIVFALYPGMRHRMEEEILARAKEQTHLLETVRAATTIKLMGREAERESVWRNLYADVTNAGISVGKYQISMQFIQTLITGLGYVIIVYFGAQLILNNQGFSVGMLYAFLSFRQTFNDRAIELHQPAGPVPSHAAASRPLCRHRHRGSRDRNAEPRLSLDVKGSIKVRDVSFRYGAADQFVLRTSTWRSRPATSSPSRAPPAAARPR